MAESSASPKGKKVAEVKKRKAREEEDKALEKFDVSQYVDKEEVLNFNLIEVDSELKKGQARQIDIRALPHDFLTRRVRHHARLHGHDLF